MIDSKNSLLWYRRNLISEEYNFRALVCTISLCYLLLYYYHCQYLTSLNLSHFIVSLPLYSRAKPQQIPSVENHTHPPRVLYCAICSTLTRFTMFRGSNLHIISTLCAAKTLHQRILSTGAIPSHYFPLREDSLGTTGVRQLLSGSCHHPTAATK